MPKLHELLAVNANLKGQADQCRQGLIETFNKKRHHFGEKLVTFQPIEEGAQPVTEEQSDLQTTVNKELAWVSDSIANSLDVAYQISRSNQTAVASIILEDGTTLASDVPATALLELEQRLSEIHGLASQIPTLDPAKGFRPDSDRGKDIYVARPDNRPRTKKTPKVLVLAPATDKHPAQVQVYNEDVPVGTQTTIEWSGLITPAAKSEILNRIEEVRRAVKAARSRANSVDVDTKARIGNRLLSYVFNGR